MRPLRRFAALIALLPIAWATSVEGAREPVLKQVDVPHSYYWRELYLPQLTTGPSSASFLPGGRELVYSMAGSLWRQTIGADEAVELTHATGAYDYQPDVSADGRSVVFSRYDGAGLELWRLDLASGREQRLTSDGAVNVEPRLSPDGRRLAWVSTRRNGRFDLHVADLGPDGLLNAKAFFPERRTAIDRYYYSAWDHAINPSWSPDGQRIYFVDNADVAWGSGDLWSVAVDDPQDRRRVLREETSWSARPELAPDGRRLALFELSRAAVASALAHDPRGCAAIAAHVRRVRCAKRALVAGRRAYCIHRQRERKHRADRPGRDRRQSHAA